MKKAVVFLSLSLFLLGCGGSQPGKKAVLAKVNNYEITREEFEREFKDSSYAAVDTPQSRNEFLNNLINRKLILQEAQARGLDRDKAFLRTIERFWEQSLLKLSVDRKTREIAKAASVDDRAVLAVYKKMVQEGRTDKSYQEMHDGIKREIVMRKQAILMNDWLKGLWKKAKIEVKEVPNE
jgi:hypothetical protein